MITTRRSAIFGALVTGLAANTIVGCGTSKGVSARSDTVLTKLHVMGVIHSGHRRSQSYSIDVLRAAVRKAAPDVILTEIPPDRIDQAVTSYRETGVIDEPRTRVFPEYTDVVFPLLQEMDFKLFGTAGWTRAIANNRRDALRVIENDPARAQEWAAYLASQREYSRAVNGRGDDPLFIHTEEFDRIVERTRAPYEGFDADLGPGGWTQINRAHTNLINAALDSISGQGLRTLVMFGTAHKYKILQSINHRDDIELLDTRQLFA